ncbi:hypothetical protein B0H66DRAFT_214173 [Apodospora peruviana]|uniref:FAD-binding domain-containing protein n=1 Tax=Apodospora peruviana TaxID=516989 RepID=A0AAE0M7V8_9PEZI|nr:hypothetical protein B0H66DRAFT_214173 [Apodospora peruviana]
MAIQQAAQPSSQKLHVLIIGGGIAGLTLAQALRKYNISFTVFERDESATSRPQGWGISLHSTLVTLENHVPGEVYDAICQAQVNPEAGRDEVRGVPFVNLDTGKVEHMVPKSKRLRLRRDGVRLGLTKGLDILWGKKLASISRKGDDNAICATFEDGTSYTGTVLVGADGAHSAVRRILAPDNNAWENRRLPCNAIGTSYYISGAKVNELREQVDPLYFFGTDPKTNTYAFWSMLEQPDDGGMMYKMQLYFSWIPSGDERELVGLSPAEVFKLKGATMFPTLREVMAEMPEDAVVSYVNLVEWPAVAWDNWDGMATLAGDAAHCMSIYRGEGVNHGIIDGCVLADALKRAADGVVCPRKAVEEYEAEMRLRGKEAVDVSHQACLDAHDYRKIETEGSFALLGAKKV